MLQSLKKTIENHYRLSVNFENWQHISRSDFLNLALPHDCCVYSLMLPHQSLGLIPMYIGKAKILSRRVDRKHLIYSLFVSNPNFEFYFYSIKPFNTQVIHGVELKLIHKFQPLHNDLGTKAYNYYLKASVIRS